MGDLAAYFWVAVGGAMGSVARFALGNAMTMLLGAKFPWGTLLINIIGSFVISAFGSFAAGHARGLPYELRLFVTVGICGGFTTFSSFSLQVVDLARSGQPGRALAYVVASVVLCIASCALGVAAGQAAVAPRAS